MAAGQLEPIQPGDEPVVIPESQQEGSVGVDLREVERNAQQEGGTARVQRGADVGAHVRIAAQHEREGAGGVAVFGTRIDGRRKSPGGAVPREPHKADRTVAVVGRERLHGAARAGVAVALGVVVPVSDDGVTARAEGEGLRQRLEAAAPFQRARSGRREREFGQQRRAAVIAKRGRRAALVPPPELGGQRGAQSVGPVVEHPELGDDDGLGDDEIHAQRTAVVLGPGGSRRHAIGDDRPAVVEHRSGVEVEADGSRASFPRRVIEIVSPAPGRIHGAGGHEPAGGRIAVHQHMLLGEETVRDVLVLGRDRCRVFEHHTPGRIHQREGFASLIQREVGMEVPRRVHRTREASVGSEHDQVGSGCDRARGKAPGLPPIAQPPAGQVHRQRARVVDLNPVRILPEAIRDHARVVRHELGNDQGPFAHH
ncbi:MAG: hypothetical protein M5U12_18660 [Verrucomicrobia bacterium]|nr:hypothetical protein [Verrucomicrobiota bacterium]